MPWWLAPAMVEGASTGGGPLESGSMRWKIITVNAVVIILLGFFSYAILRAQLSDLVSNETRAATRATRAVSAANVQLQLDALRVERWLDQQAETPAAREPFQASIQAARSEAATQQANRIQAAAAQNTLLAGMPPAIVAFVDANGVSLGRNGNNLMRGEDLGKDHPKMKESIARGQSGSSVWFSPQRSQQWFVSYAPVRDDDSKILGAIIYGSPLNDERLTRTTDKTTGEGLVVAVLTERGLEAVAKSSSIPTTLASAMTSGTIAKEITDALKQETPTRVGTTVDETVLVAGALEGYAAGEQRAVLVGATSARVMHVGWLVWSILGMVLLGLVMVSVGGVLLGNYISRPVEQVEDGLLQILNGQTELRFDIEHAVLGGLIFRLNTLLNQLMGVQEDDTDDEGRPSVAPSAQAFGRALEVDENQAAGTANVDASAAAALAAEPVDHYYRRIFQEYIQAKRSIGDPTDHITEDSFIERIRQRETETSQNVGRSVRYQVQLRGKEVVLIAVQLP